MAQYLSKFMLHARVREFTTAAVATDVLVIGRRAPIGSGALRKVLHILLEETFELLQVDDEVLGDVVAKTTLLERLSRERLLAFLVTHVKPVMDARVILHVQIDFEFNVWEELE